MPKTKGRKMEVLMLYWSPSFYREHLRQHPPIPALCMDGKVLSPDEMRSLRNVEVWLIPDQDSAWQVSAAQELRNELNKYGVVQITKRVNPKPANSKKEEI